MSGASTTTLTPTGSWKVDPAHSSVTFQVKHMMIATVRGRFDEFEGTLTTDQAGGLRAEGIIRAASINTNEARRDEHLRSADFFEAETYPEIRFASTGIEHVKNDVYRVSGTLTIKDVTRPIELEAQAEGTGQDPWGNERAGVTATGEINRTHFGLRWNQALEAGGVLVGDKVRLAIDISAVRVPGE